MSGSDCEQECDFGVEGLDLNEFDAVFFAKLLDDNAATLPLSDDEAERELAKLSSSSKRPNCDEKYLVGQAEEMRRRTEAWNNTLVVTTRQRVQRREILDRFKKKSVEERQPPSRVTTPTDTAWYMLPSFIKHAMNDPDGKSQLYLHGLALPTGLDEYAVATRLQLNGNHAAILATCMARCWLCNNVPPGSRKRACIPKKFNEVHDFVAAHPILSVFYHDNGTHKSYSIMDVAQLAYSLLLWASNEYEK